MRGIDLNRQVIDGFRRFSGQAGRTALPSGMDDTAALAEIRRAAQAAIDVWPDARAAALFGSRARGNHRPDSDWDIAFILRGSGDRIGVPPDGLFRHRDVGAYVNSITLPESLIRRKACSVGHVAHAVIADGRTIAGTWNRPETRGKLHMDTEKYERFVAIVLDMAGNGATAMIELSEMPDERSMCTKADRFAVCSSGAAEFMAKAVMCRHAISWNHSHDMNVLAQQLREAGHHAMAERVALLNGWTKTDHLAMYDGISTPGLVHAIARLPVTLDLLRDELTDMSVGFFDPSAHENRCRQAASMCAQKAEALRQAIGQDGPEPPLPPVCEWIRPLLDFRPVLAEMLETVASQLRDFDAKADARKENGDGQGWTSPEPQPSGDSGGPFGKS